MEHPRPTLTELESAARELGTAWGTRDMVALDRLLAADYIHTDVSGLVLDRAAWLGQVRARTTTFSVEVDDLAVTPLGDTALVTGRNRISGPSGSPFELRFTQTWVLEGGRWRRRAFQATRIVQPATVAAGVEAEVRAASAAWSEAIKRRDVEAAGQFLGEEYSLMGNGVGEVPRARWLENLPSYVVQAYEFTDVKVQVHGDLAVMRAHYTQTATMSGKDRSGAMLVTDVWVKRDGRWQVVARHSSFL